MKADARQLFFLKALLNSFAESTGLKVNFHKSMMVPINIADDKLEILSRTLGCAKGSLPFIYLGLPPSLTRPTIADYWPLVSRCERQLVSISNFLSEAGRLQLTNAVFCALPTFAMSTYLLPKTVIKQIDKFRKHCLWRGSDVNSKKSPKAAWPMTCVPKQNGGLGVLNLHIHNQNLLKVFQQVGYSFGPSDFRSEIPKWQAPSCNQERLFLVAWHSEIVDCIHRYGHDYCWGWFFMLLLA